MCDTSRGELYSRCSILDTVRTNRQISDRSSKSHNAIGRTTGQGDKTLGGKPITAVFDGYADADGSTGGPPIRYIERSSAARVMQGAHKPGGPMAEPANADWSPKLICVLTS